MVSKSPLVTLPLPNVTQAGQEAHQVAAAGTVLFGDGQRTGRTGGLRRLGRFGAVDVGALPLQKQDRRPGASQRAALREEGDGHAASQDGHQDYNAESPVGACRGGGAAGGDC